MSNISSEVAKDILNEVPEDVEHNTSGSGYHRVHRDAVLVVEGQQVPGYKLHAHGSLYLSIWHSHEGGDVAADDTDHVHSKPRNKKIWGLVFNSGYSQVVANEKNSKTHAFGFKLEVERFSLI